MTLSQYVFRQLALRPDFNPIQRSYIIQMVDGREEIEEGEVTTFKGLDKMYDDYYDLSNMIAALSLMQEFIKGYILESGAGIEELEDYILKAKSNWKWGV
jgi:hypothetical protein